MKAQIEALNIYIQRNFQGLKLIPEVKTVTLAGIEKWQILTNGKSYVCDNEVQAWIFIDGIYTALKETNS